jgi:hypothetical protein
MFLGKEESCANTCLGACPGILSKDVSESRALILNGIDEYHEEHMLLAAEMRLLQLHWTRRHGLVSLVQDQSSNLVLQHWDAYLNASRIISNKGAVRLRWEKLCYTYLNHRPSPYSMPLIRLSYSRYHQTVQCTSSSTLVVSRLLFRCAILGSTS